MTPKKKISLLGLGALVLIGLNLSRDMRRLASFMEWSRVEEKPLHRSVTSPGVIEAVRVEDIIVEVRETVEKIYVEPGQFVKEGQRLMSLSQTSTRLEFEQRQSAYEDAAASLKRARKELRVQKKLLQSFAVTETQVEDASRALDRALSQKKIAEREFSIVKKKLESTEVKSPIDGQVLKIHVKEGARIYSDVPVVTVGDTSKFVATAKVDELDIQKIQIGREAEISVDAFPGQPVKGRVENIAIQADRSAFAKIDVTIEILDSGELDFKHNLSCRVSVFTEKIPSGIGIPYQAVLRKNGENGWVMAKGALGFIREKKIQLDGTAGDLVVVKKGLHPGDLVGVPQTQTSGGL